MLFRRDREQDPRVLQDPHRLPPGQVLTQKWPVLSYGSPPGYDMTKWRLRLFGEVGAPATLSWQDVRNLPSTQVTADMHCVTTWSRLDNHWEGVAFRDLAGLVQPTSDARYVIAHCDAGYTTSLPVELLADEDVLIAYRHDGEELSADHGGPLRLVVPKRYAWKSAKWLEGLEWVKFDRLGFWEKNGYNNSADPWKEERYW
ncbi:MAG TPA: sulfite oxidase-like oxidoreductase [Candidatus Dormibacteraeota bacterium]|nr:sulfite oxidase-like oxidoreductase [Candidatus Dormibacteraeota bacterium]